MVPSPEHDTPEVPEVPGEDGSTSRVRHGHDGQVGQIGTRVGVPRSEVERLAEFGLRRNVELVDAIEQSLDEGDRCVRVAAAAQQEVDFGDDRPRYERLPTQPCEQSRSESVSFSFVAIQCRNDGPGVADDQLARRDNTSSTRRERSSSSSTMPAYGSSASSAPASSATRAENVTPRRAASSSSWLARLGGSEIVRRTEAMQQV